MKQAIGTPYHQNSQYVVETEAGDNGAVIGELIDTIMVTVSGLSLLLPPNAAIGKSLRFAAVETVELDGNGHTILGDGGTIVGGTTVDLTLTPAGWLPTLPLPRLQQEFSAVLLTDFQVTDPSAFVDVPGMSVTLTPAPGSTIRVQCTVACFVDLIGAPRVVAFRLLDGAAVICGSAETIINPGGNASLSLSREYAIGPAAPHTIKLQTAIGGAVGRINVRPLAEPNTEHSCLIVENLVTA